MSDADFMEFTSWAYGAGESNTGPRSLPRTGVIPRGFRGLPPISVKHAPHLRYTIEKTAPIDPPPWGFFMSARAQTAAFAGAQMNPLARAKESSQRMGDAVEIHMYIGAGSLVVIIILLIVFL
jgi:hypothetical protein